MFFKKIKSFFNDAIEEIKKCTWPNKFVLFKTTLMVLFVIFILSSFIILSDLFSQKLLKFFMNIK